MKKYDLPKIIVRKTGERLAVDIPAANLSILFAAGKVFRQE